MSEEDESAPATEPGAAPTAGEEGAAERWVRRGDPEDAALAGRLLHDFNSEFGDPTPGPEALAVRLGELIADREATVALLGGWGERPAEGIALLRFRPSIFTPRLDCYLAELYVAPERRGQGLGRALMEAALDAAREQGADYIDLNTSEADRAARRLYESLGFRNTEQPEGGPVSLYYEREL